MSLTVTPQTRIYLALEAVDMRLGYNGLSTRVQHVLRLDPFSGALFLFRGKRGDRLKALVWDGSGLCLFYKRLQSGRFVWPGTQDGVLRLTSAQLAMLIEGLNWKQAIIHTEPVTPTMA